MSEILDFFREKDKLAQHLRIELVSVGKGSAVARMEIREEHLNGVRTVHGGAIFTLADFAFAAACNSYDQIAVAVHVDINFIRAASSGTLTVEVHEVSAEKSLGNYEARVTDEQGELIATFHGLSYRKRESLLQTFG